MNKNPRKTKSEYVKRHSKGQFYTDVNLMPLIFKLFKLDIDEKDILEPSCGCGNFIDAVLNKSDSAKIDGVDNDKNVFKLLVDKYKDKNVRLFNEDYLKYVPDKQYDIVIGNPPFNLPAVDPYYNTTDAFVLKSLDLLKENGYLIMVLPSTFLRNKQYQNAREIIINEHKIIGIINSTKFDFLGADVETIVICIQKQKVRKQHYFYFSDEEKKLVRLCKNSCSTIQIKDNEFADYISEKIGKMHICDLFDVYRGRSKQKKSLKGRDIDFYGNFLKPIASISKPKIVVQNIAYRLVANVSFDEATNISDTVTILEPIDKRINLDSLLLICNYLNSSIANYLLHSKFLNFSMLTIHIDKYYIDYLPIPDTSASGLAVDLDKNAKQEAFASMRNNLFYKLFDLNQKEIEEIEYKWILPRFKIKGGINYEVSRTYA